MFAVLVFGVRARAEDSKSGTSPDSTGFATLAQKTYETAHAKHLSNTNDIEAAWQFARACFDWSEFLKSNSTRREEVAQEGIAACKQLLEQSPSSAAGHYYLAMNLGELADIRRFSALKKIVPQMEAEFKAALGLDPQFDSAGPDRNLGMLYVQAPGWPLSLGSRAKGKHHLLQALKLAPEYPENLLNIIEAQLDWGEKKEAVKNLDALDDIWPRALAKLNTPEWGSSWADWSQRRKFARKKAGLPAREVVSPKLTEQN
jgi:tetratricopeptide (TPR) repeat protein